MLVLHTSEYETRLKTFEDEVNVIPGSLQIQDASDQFEALNVYLSNMTSVSSMTVWSALDVYVFEIRGSIN